MKATVQNWTGRETRLLRQALRMSVRDFAAHLGTAPRTVSYWESHHTTRPCSEIQAALDTALGRLSPDGAVRFSAGLNADQQAVGEDDEMERRSVLRQIVVGTGVGLAAPLLVAVDRVRRELDVALDASNVSASRLDEWDMTAFEHAQGYQTLPPRLLLADVLDDFQEVKQLLGGEQPMDARRRLWRSAGQFAALAGILMSSLGHSRDARRWFTTSRRAAEQAADNKLAGLATVRAAIVAFYYATPASALRQASEAQRLLGDTASASNVRALIVEARALAKLDRADEARASIRKAEAMFERVPPDDIRDPALGYTERQFLFNVGNAYTHLGMSQHAAEAQGAALAMYRPTEYLDPALVRLDQATCLRHDGDITDACALAVQTIAAIPEDHRAGLISHYGRDFVRELPATARSLPVAGELRELLQ